jgi:hypothetical protein
LIRTEDTALTPEQTHLLKTLVNHGEIFAVAATRSSERHRIYRTSRGYIGVAPMLTDVGDQVWMLCDSQRPLLLRPTAKGGEYYLVGPSYLHGCMHGEMITEELKERIGPVRLV